MKQLTRYFKGYYKELILGPVFKLAEAVLELFIPLLMANIIDIGIKNGDKAYIVTHGLRMLLLGAVGLCFALICQYFAAVCAQGFGRSLRKSLFRHVFGLSEAETGTLGINSLITRLTNDVNQVQTGVNMFIRLAVRAPFLAIGSVVMAIGINPEIGIIFLISTPLIVAVLYVIMRRSVPFYVEIQTKQDGIARLAGENLAGARVIRAFSKQESEMRQFNAASDALADAMMRVGKISMALNPITSVIVHVAIVAIIWFGGGMVNGGALTQGALLALVSYMTQTLLALIVLANLIVIFTKAIASAHRVCAVFDTECSMSMPEKSAATDENAPCIAFENVSFSYPHSGENALQNISFTLQKGETLGIIGGTGCGKSTLVKLLAREYDAGSGRVLLHGVDVKEMTAAALHAKIGLVPQTAMLLSGSVRDNLRLGAPQADDAALWQALATAQGKEFVEKMPDGLDTHIAEGGKNLSGGQKQRLTIARALVTQPEILVLDDAASALDYATDAALRKALKSTEKAMAVIFISQRAATLKHANHILVLEDGNAAGFGTHAQLLASCEIYREICASQGIARNEAIR
ncbi:MAG: ABC transporter ATP-binding protein [Ruthenibacterium sp.]